MTSISNFHKHLVLHFIIAVASASIAVINGTQMDVAAVQASGILKCRDPGSNNPGTPITNATVAVDCDGSSFDLGTTDQEGAVTVGYHKLGGFLFDPSTCNSTVTLGNASSCRSYPTTWTTSANLEIIYVVNTTEGLIVGTFMDLITPLVT